MLIIGIFIVERRVRFVNTRCNEIEAKYVDLKTFVDKCMTLEGDGDVQTDPAAVVTTEHTIDKHVPGVVLTGICITPPHVISVVEEVQSAPVEAPKTTVVAAAQPLCTEASEEKIVSKKKAPSSENELVDLLKSVDAIQDLTKPVVMKKTEEEKQLKQMLRAKGLSCKGTIDELRARSKEAAQVAA